MVVVETTSEGATSVGKPVINLSSVTTVGLDLAKRVFPMGDQIRETFSGQIRQRAPSRGNKWHLDEVAISIAGQPYGLWRAVDQNGFVLDVLVQRRRHSHAARRTA
jgi:hypothetical protein